MAFLVEEKSKQKKKSSRQVDRIDIEMLVIGKRAGLSFAELNEFRAVDLLAYIESYVGINGDEEIPKEATQRDIDGFFSG